MRLTHAMRWCLVIASPLLPLTLALGPEPLPQVTAAPATTYPTTKTRIWSTTKTYVDTVLWINPKIVTYLTTITATTLEPGPIPPPYPATVVQTVISHVTWATHARISAEPYPSVSLSSSTSSWTGEASETWVVTPAKVTDLSYVSSNQELKCVGEGVQCAGVKQEGECDSLGLRTACLGQCELRGQGRGEEMWWCYRMLQREYGEERRRMGRACWGGYLKFKQLNEPCVKGDVGVGCVPCQGVNESWAAVFWDGFG